MMPSRTAHSSTFYLHIVSSYDSFLRLSLLWWPWQSSLVKDSVKVFCRKSLNWGVHSVFLMVRLGLWVWGRETTGVKHPFQHVLSASCVTADTDLEHVPGPPTLQLRFSILYCPLYPLSDDCELPLLRAGELCSTSSRWVCPHNLFQSSAPVICILSSIHAIIYDY